MTSIQYKVDFRLWPVAVRSGDIKDGELKRVRALEIIKRRSLSGLRNVMSINKGMTEFVDRKIRKGDIEPYSRFLDDAGLFGKISAMRRSISKRNNINMHKILIGTHKIFSSELGIRELSEIKQPLDFNLSQGYVTMIGAFYDNILEVSKNRECDDLFPKIGMSKPKRYYEMLAEFRESAAKNVLPDAKTMQEFYDMMDVVSQLNFASGIMRHYPNLYYGYVLPDITGINKKKN